MRHIGFALIALALASGGALAGSPEDDYVALRDKDIARIQRLTVAKTDQKKVDAEQTQMLAELQKRLAAIVGPFAVAGYPAAGKFTLETLSGGDIGFGQLDGMVHSAGDDGPQVIVTTRGLVDRWLSARSTEKDADGRLPADFRRRRAKTDSTPSPSAKTRRSAKPPSWRSASRPARISSSPRSAASPRTSARTRGRRSS